YLLLVEPKADSPDSVEEILAGEENVDIYTLQGVRVAHDVVAAEGLRDLEPGIYIIRTQKSSVKVIKK
ncbi:MAG: T9SS type A sorting domain-containing protein, partial [Bacteroides sp.]|nr:T9SS type A sorting domain-containing protein [Bacteroides sp.]